MNHTTTAIFPPTVTTEPSMGTPTHLTSFNQPAYLSVLIVLSPQLCYTTEGVRKTDFNMTENDRDKAVTGLEGHGVGIALDDRSLLHAPNVFSCVI